MAGKKGYEAVKILRVRPRNKRGGNEQPKENFSYEGQTLAVFLDQFLDHLRSLNRAEKHVRSQWNALKYFLRWTHERDLIYPDQITFAVLESH